jgi:hypothetical protein
VAAQTCGRPDSRVLIPWGGFSGRAAALAVPEYRATVVGYARVPARNRYASRVPGRIFAPSFPKIPR